MMRWKRNVVGLALTIILAAGCTQGIRNLPDEHHYEELGLPYGSECKPDLIKPPASTMPAPTTINDLKRPARNITLRECVAMALENGTTGLQSTRLFGTLNDDLVTFTGGPPLVTGSDSIRVLALDPAAFGTEIEASLAKFDAVWSTVARALTTDDPIGSQNAFNNGNFTQVGTSLIKPLSTGGNVAVDFGSTPPAFSQVSGVTGGNFYSNFTRPQIFGSIVNPSFTPDLRFSLSQPLLQGFGVDINELRVTHPTAGNLYNNAIQVEGILITRLRFDMSRAEFERAVAYMLANVETAYWNLYGAYFNLYSSEQGLRFAYESYRIGKSKFELGKEDITVFGAALGQYEQFRGDRFAAVGQVLERERTLRGLIGLPVEDGTRLVPIDPPTVTPYAPDWSTALNEALSLRPELVIAREDLRTRQLELIRQKNLLLPDLRFDANYAIHGLGTRLDGNGQLDPASTGGVLRTDNAFRSLASGHFADWQLGLTLNIPIGYRNASAAVRQAHLRLAQGFLQLREQEDRASRYLAQQYRTMFEQYAVIQARRAQRNAFGQQLEARYKQFAAGKTGVTIEFVLESQRNWAQALSAEYQAIVAYNNALTGFEFGKGTILQHDNVVIAEGPLPCCAQMRAVEHERQKAKALMLRQAAAPGPGVSCCGGKGGPCLPKLPTTSAPALPTLMNGDSFLPDVPADQLLPAPTPERRPPERLPEATPERTDAGTSAPVRELPPAVTEAPAPAPATPAPSEPETGTVTFTAVGTKPEKAPESDSAEPGSRP
jgi:outer membrane protein TolC